MFKREFDIFLAYHSTYDIQGPKKVADQLYDYLVDNQYKVFYFPRSGSDSYKANIINVMRSKTFLLLCNEKLERTENGRIDQSIHYELSTEIDAFYALTQLGADVTVQDSKILVCGNYDGNEGKEEKIHELFSNRTHFFFNDKSFDDVKNWLEERVKTKNEEEIWRQSQTTNEVLEVFARRSSMSQRINLSQLIASSSMIKCVGISNSEVTIKMDVQAIKHAIDRGANIEILFLDPECHYTLEREQEEGLRPNRIKNITLFNLEHAFDVKNSLLDVQKPQYRLLKYCSQPRMNMIILDKLIILQYYSNKVAGMSNPCFLIEKQQGESPLFNFCLASYEELKKNAEEIFD